MRALHKASATQVLRRRLELSKIEDRAVVADRQAVLYQPFFLQDAVLNNCQHCGPRANRRMMLRRLKRSDRNLFNLQSYNIAAPCKVSSRARIVPACFKAGVNHKASWTGRIGIEHLDTIAERTRCHRHHATQLSATEDADRRTWKNHLLRRHQATGSVDGRVFPGGSVWSSTSCLRLSRQAHRRSRNARSSSARIEIASSAAFAAPGLPMASVPTGTPLGICTMERSESTPASMVAGIGTPSTGRCVLAASIPGR